MAPTTLFSTISDLFLPECLNSNDRTPPHRVEKRKQVTCNQYQRRLYLRPIMPMTKRQRARVENGEVEVGKVEGDVKSESVGKEEEGNDDVKPETQMQEVGDSLERRQSAITFDARAHPQDTGMEDVDLNSPAQMRGLKQRTLSMEVHEALDALHRSDDGKEIFFCVDGSWADVK
jgi:hypothetical protein